LRLRNNNNNNNNYYYYYLNVIKVNATFSLEEGMKVRSGFTFLKLVTREGEPMPRPTLFIPGEETLYPFYTKLGGPQGLSDLNFTSCVIIFLPGVTKVV
jgi:hypothetical protein